MNRDFVVAGKGWRLLGKVGERTLRAEVPIGQAVIAVSLMAFLAYSVDRVRRARGASVLFCAAVYLFLRTGGDGTDRLPIPRAP